MLKITDGASIREMHILAILLIYIFLKWCIHLSRGLFLYFNANFVEGSNVEREESEGSDNYKMNNKFLLHKLTLHHGFAWWGMYKSKLYAPPIHKHVQLMARSSRLCMLKTKPENESKR